MKKLATSLLVLALLVVQIVVPAKSVHAEEYPTVTFGQNVTGNITETSYENTYKITLSKSGKININLISQIGTLYTELDDSNGKNVTSTGLYNGSQQNPQKWQPSVDLEAGDYYLKVWNYGDETGIYNFTVNYTAAGTNDVEPNNGTVTAQPLTLNSGAITGYLSWNDDEDVYKIQLLKAGRIDLTVITQFDNMYADLEDINGNKVTYKYLYDGSTQNPKTWAESVDLEAGTYYLVASKNSDNTGKYSVKVNYTAAGNNDVEPNDGTATAQPLTLNSSAITGYLTWNDDQDVYKIVLPKSGRIDMTLATQDSHTYVDLQDKDGNKIMYDYIYDGTSQNPKIWIQSADLYAGTYYLKVAKDYAEYTGKYTLKANYSAANNNDVEPNDGTATAQSLALNSGTMVGYFPYGDDKDVFKIVVPKTETVKLNLTSWMSETDFELDNYAGNSISYDYLYDGTLQNPKTLSKLLTLNAGTYYLVVDHYSNYTGKYAVNIMSYNSVTFSSNGGSILPSQSILYNTKATKPSNPTRAGYAFGGWYKNSTLTTLFDFNTPITANTVVYAKWTPVAPAAPLNAKAVSAGYNSVTTSWSAVSFANGYAIYRSTAANGTYAKIGETTATSYVNAGLTMGTTYYYKVIAFRTVGTTRLYSSKYSTVVSAKPTLGTPSRPSATLATSGIGFKINWSAVGGANGYEVYRSTALYGTYSKIGDVKSATFTNTGLKKYTYYYYKVRAYRMVGTTKVYSNFSVVNGWYIYSY